MSSQTLAIETMGLSKHFGQYRAVDTLNLSIHQGSIFGFLGLRVCSRCLWDLSEDGGSSPWCALDLEHATQAADTFLHRV
jgi:hypothetical protein